MNAVAYAEQVVSFRTPRGTPALMTIREGTNDWNTLNACMTEDEYGLRDWHGDGWAFDIGGYLGGVGIGLALDNPGLQVLIVEPVPDNARLIRENIARNDVGDRVEVLENAAGGVDRAPVSVWYGYVGTATAEHHAFVGNSSLAYDHGGELTHEEKVYHYPLTIGDLLDETLGDLIARTGADVPPVLVKIDCEGGEWDILADVNAGFIDYIVGEAHAVRGHKGGDIVELLSATHDVTIQGDPEGTCEFRAVLR